MCYGTSHLRIAHPIPVSAVASRNNNSKSAQTKRSWYNSVEEMFTKKGRPVISGPWSLLFPRNRMLDKPPRRRASLGESGIPVPSRRLGAFPAQSSSQAGSCALSMSIQMCLSKMIRLATRRRVTAGGGAYREGARMPQRWSFHRLARVDCAPIPSCSSPVLNKGFFQTAQRLRKCCREAEDGVKGWHYFSFLTSP